MVCNGYVAGRIAASRGLATFSNLEMQHSPKIFCIFLQKVLAKNTLGGAHHVSVREHRTAIDWAEEIKYLADVMYPDVEKIILVMDNLNTHKPASLYKRYPADEARRIMKRLEIHYTPKHGSWLDIAEIELNVMTRQCLNRRIDNISNLRKELSAWEVERNTVAAKVNWQFRTEDARIKLNSLYPTFTTASE